MNRQDFLSSIGLLAGGSLAGNLLTGEGTEKAAKKAKPILTVAHITDVHIREGDDAPARFKKVLRNIIDQHKPDFFLNTGDSIHDASYDSVVRQQVTDQWALWDECVKSISKYEMHSCLGNHDMWWKAPSKEDEMYGKNYAVKRLGTPNRYYTIKKENWHFFMLDGNNKGISLDEEQFNWLKGKLEAIPEGEFAVMTSHYPILGTTQVLEGGGHSDCKLLKDLFYKTNRVRLCLSGHNHLSDNTVYNGITYACNGAMSGFWWGKGDKNSAGPYFYQETPPGFAILKLYKDGTLENTYYPHGL
ncbi:metallophosphoesterase [Chitinophaga sp.]|uniref:metallophosphoesterase family protein n=1 Tax=Chitinophaga sp. TaxID=1869181 RepID=UPI0026272CDA|nr:metallophosphoesterase [uncultured Chitinophaga sp.]